jgi:CYTH domain-containing protein
MNFSKTDSAREIERKFLIERLADGLTKFRHAEIDQGYLAVGPGGIQVRLRKKGSVRSLTYKSRYSNIELAHD